MQTCKALIISFCSHKNEPRVFKEILALRDYFDIRELSFAPSGLTNNFIKINWKNTTNLLEKISLFPSMFFGNINKYLKRYFIEEYNKLINEHYDIIISNDIRPCPLAFSISKGSPVFIDLAEYHPKLYDDKIKWRLFFEKGTYNLCKEYLPKAAGCFTVSKNIANKYYNEFNVRPTLVYNAPLFVDIPPSVTKHDQIRLVHHGLCAEGRHIEVMFSLMEKLDSRFELHLYLVGFGDYYDRIKMLSHKFSNIFWHEPVPMEKISVEMNKYDIGLFMLPANTFNHDNTLASKFFEFIQSRLVTAVWPTKSMKKMIDKYDTGFYTKTFSVDDMALRINKLTNEDINRYKANSDSAARKLTGEISIKIIRDSILDVLHGRSGLC